MSTHHETGRIMVHQGSSRPELSPHPGYHRAIVFHSDSQTFTERGDVRCCHHCGRSHCRGISLGFALAAIPLENTVGTHAFDPLNADPDIWDSREPLSDVPVDLVVLIVLMPYTMRFLRPSKPLRRWTRRIWRRLSAQLRLSSYMFGKRYPLEEFTTREWSLASIFTVHEGMEVQDSEAMRDGGFRRVPASDSVMLEKNVPGVAQVDEFGNPLDQRNSRVMQLQDSEALRTNRDVHKDYTVVYVPPYFRLRLICFIALLWIIGSAFTAAVITFPTLLGRAAFTALVGREVHDGYSFLAGFYLLWGAWAIGKSLDRMDKRRQRERDWEGPKAHWAIWVIKRVLRWCATISYLVFTLGFVLPTLVALVVELYIVLPLRLTINPALPVRIRIVDMWMLGILYTKILLRTRRMQVRSPLMRGIDRVSAFSFISTLMRTLSMT